MRSSTLRDLILLLAIGAGLFVGGYFIVKEIGKSDLDLSYEVSYEQEEKLGNMMKDMIWDEFETVKDNAADSALKQITDRLIKALDTTHYRYEFNIIKKDQINAFTIPGGNIYVFSELMKVAETPEEVAAVLAHEIGHAENRHVVTKLIQELSITAIVGVLSGGDPSVLTNVLTSIIGNTFSRAQEEEADKFAMELLEKANISPKSLARFFERLNEKDLDYDENLEILMTHPHNDKRIEQVRRYKTKNDFKPVPFDLDWKKVQDSL
ncbi:MAG TPA: M48 family metallopeptidase [Cyclobacteriaceae bacterium]|nr:M48 family metallopeptidase [Cyclobacteriaceae bacterium]